jgi:hypothetical protein
MVGHMLRRGMAGWTVNGTCGTMMEDQQLGDCTDIVPAWSWPATTQHQLSGQSRTRRGPTQGRTLSISAAVRVSFERTVRRVCLTPFSVAAWFSFISTARQNDHFRMGFDVRRRAQPLVRCRNILKETGRARSVMIMKEKGILAWARTCSRPPSHH